MGLSLPKTSSGPSQPLRDACNNVAGPAASEITIRQPQPDFALAAVFGRPRQNSKKYFAGSQLQRASPIRSRPCHQVRSESKTQLTLVQQVNSARVTIRQTHTIVSLSLSQLFHCLFRLCSNPCPPFFGCFRNLRSTSFRQNSFPDAS
jgi:hypothetical protein